MAHLLRGKQAGIQNDLSLGVTPDLFVIDDVQLSRTKTLESQSLTKYVDKPLWHQLADISSRIRSGAKSPGRRHL
jgi:hypothetical protein